MSDLQEGLLLVDKRAGVTSHDMVSQVRRITGQRRTGHAGTLDPFATGLLPMMLGRATRFIRFLPSSPKTYEGVLELGRTTSSDDLTGETLTEHSGPLPGPEEVLSAARTLTGEMMQVPPDICARKVGGQRMYRIARSGKTVAAPPAPVIVSAFDLTCTGRPETWSFAAKVSTGTYIRALARDLGATLGCGGLLTSLRRTAIGPFRVEDAIPLEEGAEPEQARGLGARIIALNDLPLDLPSFRTENQREAGLFLAGGKVALPERFAEGTMIRVSDPDGVLLGVGESTGTSLQPRVVLPAQEHPACPG